MMLNYRSANNAVKLVSITDVLQGKLDSALVKDRVVLVGYTAPIVKDDFYTPYSAAAQDDQKMPGVVIHAQNVSQILSAVLNNRSLTWYWTEGSEILWIWGWSLLGAILAWRIRRLWLFGVGVVVAVVILYGTCYLLFSSSGWVPLVPPALALVTTAVIVVLIERGYAKAIVQNVKKVILNIEIDEEKKQQQVAEITQTESFSELEKKAEELRKNRRRERRIEKLSLENGKTTEATPTSEDVEVKADVAADDYLEQLQQRGKKLKNIEPEVIPIPQDVEVKADVAADDYLEQLQQRGKKLKNIEPEVIPIPQDVEVKADGEDDYLEQLQQRGKKLKNIESEVIPIPQDVEVKADVETDNYLEQLQQRGKKLKHIEPEVTPASEDVEPAQEPEVDNYLEQLQQQGKKLKNSQPEATPILQEIEPKADVEVDNYLEQLQQQGRTVKYTIPEATPTLQNLEPAQEPEADDYFEQLQQQGRMLKYTEPKATLTLQNVELVQEPEADDYFEELKQWGRMQRNSNGESK
jgi:hypothetical protein